MCKCLKAVKTAVQIAKSVPVILTASKVIKKIG